MAAARTITDDERRHRLGRRHGFDGAPLGVPELSARLVGLHATDPASVHLACRARLPEVAVADIEALLYDEGVLVKHLGMRRTVFVLPRDLVPVVQRACTDAIAATMRKRIVADLESGGITPHGARWLETARRDILVALDDLGPVDGARLARAVPALQAKLPVAEGRTWGAAVAMSSRVIGLLAAEGDLVRGRPNGSWTSNRHRWDRAEPTALPDAAAARADLVARWLAAFGPATLDDVVWWTGLGIGQVRTALAALAVAEVRLEDGRDALVLADDIDPAPATRPWVALLPALDPTAMGWRHRDWYLGTLRADLFDRSGNIGPTIWADGRIVGGWAQTRGGEVRTRLLVDVGRETAATVDEAAAQLATWLDGVVVTPRFATPLAVELRG